MNLRYRITALAVLVAVVPLLIAGIRSVQIATEVASRNSAEILLRDADALASFVDTWVADQGQAIAGMTRLIRLADASQEERERLALAVYLAVPSVVTSTLVDRSGHAVVAPVFQERPAGPDSPVFGRPVGSVARAATLLAQLPVAEGFEQAGAAVSGLPYRPPGGDVPSVPMVAAGPLGGPLAVGAEVALDVVAREIAARSEATHGVALLTTDGHAILGVGHPLVDGGALGPLLRSRAEVSYTLADGRAVRGAVVPVPRLGCAVVVVEPLEVAQRAGAAIRRRTYWVLLMAIFVAVGMGVLVARSLALPIGRLRDNALAVADGDYGRRLPSGRSDELGELVQAFNHMSVALQRDQAELAAKQGEIEAFNAELQARVEERTRALREAQGRLVESGRMAAVAEVGAGLAHELNNPLAGILGTTQLLRGGAGSQEAALATIEQLTLRCREVVAAMLRLASDESGPEPVSVVGIHDVLSRVLDVVRPSLRQRGVSMTLMAPEPADLRVLLPEMTAERALVPLLSSLGAGLPRGSTLAVASEEVGEDVVVTVTPQGAALGRTDAFMAQGLGLWGSRRSLSVAGVRLEPPTELTGCWRLVIRRAVSTS